MNDTLRELGALTRINQLVEEPSYNYEYILNLGAFYSSHPIIDRTNIFEGQAVGNLIKCIPHQVSVA